jgi:5-methylcytosine-specific restriction enzyme subunit McrC
MNISIDLREWQKADFKTHKELAGLLLPEDAATQQMIQRLSFDGQLIVIQHYRGVSLEASSYVGRIVVGDLQITIRPKIEAVPLLQLVQYAYGFRQLKIFSPVDFNTEAFTFQDLLIYQFVQEVNELLMRGLQRNYIRRDEQLTVPRGRISIQRIANQGGIIQAALPCTHYLRVEDNLLNQVLLQGLRLGVQLTNDDTLRMNLQHLEHFHLSHISSTRLSTQLLDRVARTINRLTINYQPAITLIGILFAASGSSIDEQQQEFRIPGFLFDMNLFFQDLLARFLKEHLPEYEVREQFRLGTTVSYINNPQGRKAPELRPDYVIKRNGKIVAILDAKYRDLWQETLPPGMLYQLVMYALGQDVCESVTILYPTTTPLAEDARIEVRLPGYQGGCVYIVLRPVNLLLLADLLRRGEEKDNLRARCDFAKYLSSI